MTLPEASLIEGTAVGGAPIGAEDDGGGANSYQGEP